jgi:ketosteroid isomerase-like protein
VVNVTVLVTDIGTFGEVNEVFAETVPTDPPGPDDDAGAAPAQDARCGVRAYLAEARELWDVLEPQGQSYEDLGDRVLVSGHCRVRGRSSGAESDPPCAWVIHVRNGRIVSHMACASYAEAVELAGLEPAG